MKRLVFLVCDQSPANLQSMTPFVLGAQNPANYTVSYHMTLADANSNANPVSGPLSYCCNSLLNVYARVTSNASGNYAVSSFKVVWNLPEFTEYFSDLFECNYAILPYPINGIGAFYTEPNGQGYQMAPGEVITLSGNYYWYAGNEDCYVETSFLVMIDYQPTLFEETLVNCAGEETFDLTLISSSTSDMTFYHSEQDA